MKRLRRVRYRPAEEYEPWVARPDPQTGIEMWVEGVPLIEYGPEYDIFWTKAGLTPPP